MRGILFFKNLYEYTYFRIFSWNNFLWKNKEMAAFNSTLAITFSFVALILCVETLLCNFFLYCKFSFFNNKYISILITGAIFLVNFILLEYNNKYLKIEKKYLKHAKISLKRIVLDILIIAFVIGPIVFLLFM